MADANTLSASVRISLKDRSVEIAGTEKFVQGTLADPARLLKLIEQQKDLMRRDQEEVNELIKARQEYEQAVMDSIRKYMDQVNAINDAINRAGSAV